MSEFAFQTDDRAYKFCCEIVDQMVQLFGISRDEAVGRLNRWWSGQPIIRENNMVYHETADYWARNLYYKSGVRWCKPNARLDVDPYP